MTANEAVRKGIRLETEDGQNVVVIRKADDPVCTRVSTGGAMGKGFYCTYRSSIHDAIDVTRHALAALLGLQANGREPEIAPDDGKMFA